MDITLRHPTCRVAEQTGNCEFRKSKISRDTGECMPKNMRRNAFEARLRAHPIQYPDDTNEMAVSPIGWECEGRTLPFRHGFHTRYCSVPESPDLSTALCVREPDAMVSAADPTTLQTQNFHSAKPRQEHHSDRCKAGRMLSCGGQAPHDLSQMLKFIVAQPSLTAFDRKLSSAHCRILADDVQPGRVAEKSAQRSNSAAGNSGAASRITASAYLTASRRLAGGDVGLHPLNVVEVETTDEPSTQERLDVSLYATSVHLQRRRLDRPAIAPEDLASFCSSRIPIAHVTDRQARLDRMPLS